MPHPPAPTRTYTSETIRPYRPKPAGSPVVTPAAADGSELLATSAPSGEAPPSSSWLDYTGMSAIRHTRSSSMSNSSGSGGHVSKRQRRASAHQAGGMPGIGDSLAGGIGAPMTPKRRPGPQTSHSNPTPGDTSPGRKQPARSYIHGSLRGIHSGDSTPARPRSSINVRLQTEELASLALDEAASYHSRSYLDLSGHSAIDEESDEDGEPDDSYLDSGEDNEYSQSYDRDRHYQASQSAFSSRSASISSGSDGSLDGLKKPPSQSSHLSRLLRDSPPLDSDQERSESPKSQETRIHIGRNSSRSNVGESSSLMGGRSSGYGSVPRSSDEEAQYYHKRNGFGGRVRGIVSEVKSRPSRLWSKIGRGELTKEKVWKMGVVEPVLAVPSVILGLLLNVLDGLSYGLILFPLGEPIFSELGPDGLSMFYVSCIVSQLVYSCGGSAFAGGVGSEMIEVVPFFHKMAFTILAQVGADNPKAVLATTILAFSLSSILTGLVFFLLGACKLGSLIGFFPRHILVGCIGGVGWFLVATAFEVTAKLGTLRYNFETLSMLLEPERLALWLVPLVLAVILVLIQTRWHHPYVLPAYFMAIPAIFYIVVSAAPRLSMELLREKGWVFEMPAAGVPFWHFYTLYDFRETNWKALLNTVPAMFALTFFGILHVPINVPALGISTKMDNVDVDRELIAHGVSNALSGCCGSIQNYLVYTNSLMFIRSGGNSRLAGIMLAFATAGMMMAGPTIIGFIPVMVVGALIFLLGIELMREALYDTWGKLQRMEYLTIVIIVVTMGAWDFVVGIGIGIVLACVSYVVQTSQKSAIRASYSGLIARSTVRRNPVQQTFLRKVGHQLHVIKLAGYLFFGTIAGVESKIRAMMDDEHFERRPIRYLIVDFWHVNGVDFSAAEGFTRMRRALEKRGVEMVLSSVTASSEAGKALRSVGVWADNGTEVKIFPDLNAALEGCENSFLASFYATRDSFRPRHQEQPSHAIDMPHSPSPHLLAPPSSFTTHSPRAQLLAAAVRTTLSEEPHASSPAHPSSRYAHFAPPLPLLLQTFEKLTDKTEDFWFPVTKYFTRLEFPAGSTLFRVGDRADYFYILESGLLRAEYAMEQGRLDECIVAGTTCGELPFFGETVRTATVVVERRVVAWGLSWESWGRLRGEEPGVALELLRVALKMTSERMGAITSYILVNA